MYCQIFAIGFFFLYSDLMPVSGKAHFQDFIPGALSIIYQSLCLLYAILPRLPMAFEVLFNMLLVSPVLNVLLLCP